MAAKKAKARRAPKELKVGIVGCGHIAGAHTRCLRAVGGNRIVAISDVNRKMANSLAQRHKLDVEIYDQPLDLIKKADIDVLYLCVPPMAHGAYEKAAVNRMLPMFIEKPIAPTLAQARKIHKMLPKDLIVSVAYNWRYMSSTDRIRKVFAKTRPSGFVATWKEGIPPARWWRSVEASGGPVIEQASHLLDLGIYLIGPVKSVQAYTVAHRPKDFGDIDDLAMAVFEFESGAIGQLVHTCLLNSNIHRIGYDVIGWGVEACGQRDGSVSILTAKGIEKLPGGYNQSYENENAAFLKAVRTGNPRNVRCTYRDSMESLALGEAIAKAAKTGRKVAVPKVS